MDRPRTVWIGRRPIIDWGELSHEGYFYARHGDYEAAPPHRHDIDCSEVLDYFAEKFVMQARKLGFSSVEPASWLGFTERLVRVSWPAPGPDDCERQTKRPRRPTGNLVMECGICWERSEMQALSPCGHLLCRGCAGRGEEAHQTAQSPGWSCPFCKCSVESMLPLFKP